MKIKTAIAALLVFFCLPVFTAHAYWVWSPEQGKFVNPEGASEDSSEEQYEYAMKLYRDKDFDKAADQLKDLLKRHRASKAAPEAQYKLGVIYEEKGDYDKAFDAYRDLLTSYPQSSRADEVIEREFRIGNVFLSGRKGKLMGLEILPSLPRAIEIFEHIVKQAPYGALGDQAQFHLGLANKQAGHFDRAVEAFQAVIDNYPQSDKVSEARFQIAETAFQRSNYAARDQRALESARDHVDSFLTRYPESAVSEKAEKIRQEIDEKNAEKNFNIAAYYEKSKYLSSALIYYKDVAKRYPETHWGQKAREKLESLQEPVSYHTNRMSELEQEIAVAQAGLETFGKEDSVEKQTLERKLERLKKRQKSLEASKNQGLESREEDIRRREAELKEKQKNLDIKRKTYASNTSEDFVRAMQRWQSSLDEERETLETERRQLDSWKESLGVSSSNGLLGMIPFMGEKPADVDQVREIEARRLFKVSDEKKSLLEEKELLYKHYQEVSTMLGLNDSALSGLETSQSDYFETYQAGKEDLENRSGSLDNTRARIEALQGDLEAKRELFESRYGQSAWKSLISAPGRAVAVSADAVGRSLDVLNPFGEKPATGEKDVQKLAEYKMHLEEKVRAQRNIVDIMSQAFDEELALQEQHRLLETLNEGLESDKDVQALRKQIKGLEKEVRTAYEEIGDRHEKIKALTKQLDVTMSEHQSQTGNAVSLLTAPVRFVARGGSAFLFGRKSDEQRLTEQAAGLSGSDEVSVHARELKESIELESVMIEARNQEIYQLRKELEMLKARASLGGGYKFRSAIVEVPYSFLEDALDSARSVLPKKDRKEKLIGRLDDETRQLETYKQELARVEAEIAAINGPAAAEEPVSVPEETAPAEELDVEKRILEEEIRGVTGQLQEAKQQYAREKMMIEKEARALQSEVKESGTDKKWEEKKENMTGKEKQLSKELTELRDEISHLIRREGDLEKEESQILEKRINKIDQLIQGVNSKALAQDLLTERERLEERLTQLDSRRSFLSSELDRFEPGKTKVA